MARKSDTESVIDMFARLGQDLQLPAVDIERVIEHHRRNLEALQQSAESATAGASAVMAKQREMLENTLRQITEMAEDYRPPLNPQDLVAKQVDFARKSFETAVENATEMAELVSKSSDETLEILRKRIREGMQELREGFARKN
jgi:phasin family protein